MIRRQTTKPIRPGRALAVAVLALLAAGARANPNGTVAPAGPLAITLEAIAIPLCLLSLLPRRTLPEWVKRPRLTRAGLVLLITGPLVALGTYLPLTASTRGQIAIVATDLSSIAALLLCAGYGIWRSLARGYANWDTRRQPVPLRPPIKLGPTQLVPPPESSMPTPTWRRLARLQLVAKQRWIGLERWRIAHHTHPERAKPLIPIGDWQASYLWNSARWGISEWRVPFDPDNSPTPVSVAVGRPIPWGATPSINDRAAKLLLLALHRPYLVLAPGIAVVLGCILAGLSPTAALGPATLLATLCGAITITAQPAFRVAKGDRLPLEAQTAMRHLRFRGYHPTVHQQLWDALGQTGD